MDPDRIHFRDTISYMGVLLDDNNRQPICRLHFNTSQKYIGVFDENKNEGKQAIDELNDIYKFEKKLKQAAQYY
ncbi:MAG: hypothetical protein ACQETE_05110 [Bacteroidota bacterium]